ncbi:two-component sensor histidine kinase [Streptomyces violarus]|uniref:histidine kinase n=1 Tax=Streptomyces violarus TaxID=67380 RepID=A0A7W4ZTG4_9ACTN|nr:MULTISPECIES: histidine kinase [Streptomyces]MBB3078382.1 signal transduction histidine kinase [Streptomyces violarus]WRT99477.1 histidine kinase [Streptomyces sp. CGMCC 4.1772]GHD20791.1 two-component sensor histidine kinase [Streptomyces violarus]
MERPRSARLARGALLWAALALPALTADRIGLNEPRTVWQQAAGVAVLAGAAGLSRRLPLAAFGLAAALSLAAAPALFTVSYGPALGVSALLLGLRAGGARPAVLCFAAVGCAGTARIVLVGVDPAPEWLVMTGTLLFGCVFPWLGGRYWRQSRELAAEGWLRAARLEDEQRLAEDRARMRERSRIAQDMHDSLGHELSLIALRAGALQVAPGLAGEHRAAAADLRAAAADATDRLHRIIGVLREDDDEPVPLAPAGETLEQLVARAAESGLSVRWESAGPGAHTATGGLAERLLYRVAREALTNAARHAPGAPVVVAVTGRAEGTSVTLTNGPSTEPSSRPSGGGTGLLGLRTAVTAVGGEFEAGPQGEGFRVSAYVPAQRTATRPTRPAPFSHARRRVAVGLGIAAGVGVVLIGAAFGWYAYVEKHSVLAPAAYATLRLGAPAADVERVLPERDVNDPPAERAPTPAPEGADCRYYRASGELFVSVDHFRLCFDAGRLVSKDVVPRAGLSGEGREKYEEFSR